MFFFFSERRVEGGRKERRESLDRNEENLVVCGFLLDIRCGKCFFLCFIVYFKIRYSIF